MSDVFQESQLLWAFFGAAVLVGFSKAGIKGLGLLIVPLLAWAFGGKVSAGLLLPMLITGDVMAAQYYKRVAVWRYVWRLIPPAAIGVLLGVWVGDEIDDATFKRIISVIILASVLLLLYLERYPVKPEKVDHPLFAGIVGLLGGFCTMIGNAAGPIMSVFLLSTRLPKNEFIGTAAYFFLLINLFKFPFHFFVWGTITSESTWLNLLAIPCIVIGFWLGIKLVKWIPERAFRYFVLVMTSLVALKLLLS